MKIINHKKIICKISQANPKYFSDMDDNTKYFSDLIDDAIYFILTRANVPSAAKYPKYPDFAKIISCVI